MIFESASFISLLKQFQFQSSEDQSSGSEIGYAQITSSSSSRETIEKCSIQQNGSRRMESSDVLFIHPGGVSQLGVDSMRVIVLTKVWPTGFWTRNWWIPWQFSSFVIEILENRCLRLGRRKEEETRLHCLSNCVSSPTAAITLSMMSCGISIDFAYVPRYS